MQFDTDVLIHLERGVRAAGLAFDAAAERRISAQTWMEILAGAKDREHLARIRSMPRHLGLEIVPIDQAISDRGAWPQPPDAARRRTGRGHGLGVRRNALHRQC
jgi:predicted nucleic acid-binding protein